MKTFILTKRQQQIFEFILYHINKFGYPPSIPEIQEEFSFKSPNAVKDHLEALERKGYIARRPYKSRGIEILNGNISKSATNDTNDNITEIPLVGSVSAGTPILAQENIEGTIFVDKTIAKNNRDMFVLRIKGTSMINAGILDRDFVLVHQQSTANQGEIVVALIDDEATVKRFYREGNKIKLQPENDKMKPIVVDLKSNNVKIIGKIEGVIRKI